jgi:hypothetical protein
MKAQTAVIESNGASKLKVVLLPETDGERQFLNDAFDTCEDFDLSFDAIEPLVAV